VFVILALVIVGIRDRVKGINQVEEASQCTDRSSDPRFNAAVCYLQALDQLKYPSDNDSKQRLDDIIDHGWDPESDEADIVLQDNRRCLDSIHKASNLTRCDFSYKKPYKYLIDKEELPCSDLQKLAKLLLLNARYHEYHQNTEHIVESCLNTLTLAYHLSLDQSPLGMLVSFTIERDSYPLIRDYVESEISSAELSTLHEYLRLHKKRHIPVQALVFYERDNFISDVQMIADGREEGGGEEEAEVKKRGMGSFAQEFMRHVTQIANEYYGYFATAAMTNKADDLKKAQSAIDDLIKAVEPDIVREFTDTISLWYYSLIKDRAQYDKVYARKIIVPIIEPALPDFGPGFERFHKVNSQLEELLALVQRDLKKAKALDCTRQRASLQLVTLFTWPESLTFPVEPKRDGSGN